MVETTESRDAEVARIAAALIATPKEWGDFDSLAAALYDAGLRSTSRDSEYPLAVMVSEDAVIHQIIRWATNGLLNDAVNTPVEQEAMEAIVSGRLRRRLMVTSEAHRG